MFYLFHENEKKTKVILIITFPYEEILNFNRIKQHGKHSLFDILDEGN